MKQSFHLANLRKIQIEKYRCLLMMSLILHDLGSPSSKHRGCNCTMKYKTAQGKNSYLFQFPVIFCIWKFFGTYHKTSANQPQTTITINPHTKQNILRHWPFHKYPPKHTKLEPCAWRPAFTSAKKHLIVKMNAVMYLHLTKRVMFCNYFFVKIFVPQIFPMRFTKRHDFWKSSAPKLFSTIPTNLGTTLATLCMSTLFQK